jgi:hypothetical protein
MPSWCAVMTQPAQSYFASVNAQNTAACVATSLHGGSGISDGAKAGIGVGVPLAIVAVGVIIYIDQGRNRWSCSCSCRFALCTSLVRHHGAGGVGASAQAFSGVTGASSGGTSAPA